MIELLAPAGSPEALKAAVANGADAVYLAGAKFGARAYAENFIGDAMGEAIRYAHLRGVKVHVTVNTIVFDEETEELAAYLRELQKFGADALLVQDLGVYKLARAVVPAMPLHASTQMTVTNINAVRELASLGFERAVLSRELSLADIAAICRESPIEIEVFMHGALRVCYSGQCLMSSIIGGRSGNRGRCAQPCRLPYELTDERGEKIWQPSPAYLLSPRDLSTLEILPQLLQTGVASLKIEGRMKRPEYVATVVGTYRRAINRALTEPNFAPGADEQKALKQIFNRDFTTAYLQTNPGREMMSYLRPNNRGILVGRVKSYEPKSRLVRLKLTENLSVGDQVDFWIKVGGRVNMTVNELFTADGRPLGEGKKGEEICLVVPAPVHPHDRVFKIYDYKLMSAAKNSYMGAESKKIFLRFEVRAGINEPLVLRGWDENNHFAEVQTEVMGEKAHKHPLTEEILVKQLSRLGGTVFSFGKLTVDLADDVMFPVSVINEARRDLIAKLEKQILREGRPPRIIHKSAIFFPQENYGNPKEPLRLTVAVDTAEKVRAALAGGASAILFGGDTYDHHRISPKDCEEAWEIVRAAGKQIYWATPRVILPENIIRLEKLMTAWKKLPPTEIYVHSWGAVSLAKQHNLTDIHIDFSLIVANGSALEFWREFGARGVTLSPELTLTQVEKLAQTASIPLECVVHGRQELMISRYCAARCFAQTEHRAKCEMPCRRQKMFLRDRKGISFPLGFDEFCQMHVLNSKILSMMPYVRRLASAGISRLRLEMKNFSAREIEQTVANYVYALNCDDAEEIKKLEPTNLTRGHYFRGVQITSSNKGIFQHG